MSFIMTITINYWEQDNGVTMIVMLTVAGTITLSFTTYKYTKTGNLIFTINRSMI